jgi:hypothetical protein
MDRETLRRAVEAWEKLEACRDSEGVAKREFDGLVAPCVDFCPPTWTRHWAEYHAGHGCACDIRGNLMRYKRELEGK